MKRSDLSACLLLVAITLITRWGLLFDRQLVNDYDIAMGPINAARELHMAGPKGAPGHPLFENFSAILYHKILAPASGITEMEGDSRFGRRVETNSPAKRIKQSDSNFLVWFKLISFAGCLLILIPFFLELRRFLSQDISFLVSLTLALHPDFLWPSIAWSEDIMAAGLGFLALHLAGRPKQNWALLAVLCAVAAGFRFTALGFVAATGLRYASLVAPLNSKKGILTFIRFVALASFLVVCFYLPAYIYFHMDLSQQLSTPYYGTTFFTRIKTGIVMHRRFILWWIPIGVFLLVTYGKRFMKKQFSWDSSWDLFLFVYLLFCLLEKRFLGIPWKITVPLLTLLIAWGAVSAYRKGSLWGNEHISHWLPHVFLVAFTSWVVFMAPFASNYFLPLLPSYLYLLARRIASRPFWIAMVVITYIPMFYFFSFNWAGPNLTIYPDGFYTCLYSNTFRWNDINDFGYNTRKPLVVLGRETN